MASQLRVEETLPTKPGRFQSQDRHKSRILGHTVSGPRLKNPGELVRAK